MTTYETHCCGLREIAGLSSHTTPEDALLSFCAREMSPDGSTHWGRKESKKIYTHYIFTAAIYDEECEKSEYVKTAIKNNQKNYLPYGEEFAAYIRTQNLGTVLEGPAQFNFAFHPDHKVKIYIWTPDQEGLYDWFFKYGLEAQRRIALADIEKWETAVKKMVPGDYYHTDYTKRLKLAQTKLKEIDADILSGKKNEALSALGAEKKVEKVTPKVEEKIEAAHQGFVGPGFYQNQQVEYYYDIEKVAKLKRKKIA